MTQIVKDARVSAEWQEAHLGSREGKRDYVSGNSAYIQRYSSGVELYVSYSTVVGAFVPGYGFFRTNRKYSVTTSKHTGKFGLGAAAEASPHQLARLSGESHGYYS